MMCLHGEAVSGQEQVIFRGKDCTWYTLPVVPTTSNKGSGSCKESVSMMCKQPPLARPNRRVPIVVCHVWDWTRAGMAWHSRGCK